MNIGEILSALKSFDYGLEVELDLCGLTPCHVFFLGDRFILKWESENPESRLRFKLCTVERLVCMIEKAVQTGPCLEKDLRLGLFVESTSKSVCGVEERWGQIVLHTEFAKEKKFYLVRYDGLRLGGRAVVVAKSEQEAIEKVALDKSTESFKDVEAEEITPENGVLYNDNGGFS